MADDNRQEVNPYQSATDVSVAGGPHVNHGARSWLGAVLVHFAIVVASVVKYFQVADPIQGLIQASVLFLLLEIVLAAAVGALWIGCVAIRVTPPTMTRGTVSVVVLLMTWTVVMLSTTLMVHAIDLNAWLAASCQYLVLWPVLAILLAKLIPTTFVKATILVLVSYALPVSITVYALATRP